MKASKHPRGGDGRPNGPPPLSREKEASPPADAPSQRVGTQDEEAGTEIAPTFSVVGVGASAGGLEAFTQFLRALPTDTGMAFVLVQHLSPTHESALAEILSRATSMPVTEVADEPKLQPNHVYVIPRDRNMVIVQGHLRLLPREGGGVQHPIDQFFRSLAENQRQMAMGVVLSGTATDGTLGLEEIKAEGGITFAQDGTALQSGMPASAAASGCVDYVLPPEGIAAEIARIAKHPYVVATPDAPAGGTQAESPDGPEDLRQIIHVLRNGTGVDFSEYKVNTLMRRLRRRMVLQKTQSTHDYTQLIREDSKELEALYQDILINVTSFFRDPEVFAALRKVILPALFKERSHRDPIRFWVLGCSTGEEAYSMAMVLTEVLEASSSPPSAQVFATDLSASAIAYARAGTYPKDRMQNVSRGRLRRFFSEKNGEFRVTKSLREMCVFSRHNIMTDPPFSRMDLVSCRNLFIYLQPSLQRRILPVLHYALKSAGILVLGASETVGRFTNLFRAEDARHKIFTKKVSSGRALVLPVQRRRPQGSAKRGEKAALPPDATREAGPAVAHAMSDVYKEADRLLAAFAPPSVLVDGNLEVLQIHGNIEPYLAPAQGRATLALLKMAREGLLVPIRALLHRAKEEQIQVHEDGVRVKSEGGFRTVNLEVLPITRPSTQGVCFLLLFKDSTPVDEPAAKTDETVRKKTRGAKKPPTGAGVQEGSAAEIRRLEHELASTREHLQVLLEQYETTNEELQSSNEEAESANEELQSINEELETSKEEIQSSNEELTTVNDELNNRNQEVSQLNNDLTNLIGSVQLAIVIVGRDLCIRRFSPKAEKLLNFIQTDIGRPITDIRMGIDLPNLDALLDAVIETVSPKECQVQDEQGRWWSVRMRPYLTLDNKIDGAVLMLVDIDALKASEQEIAAARDYLRKWENIFNHAGWAVATVHSKTGALERVNPAFAKMHGHAVRELIGKPLSDMLAPDSRKDLDEYMRSGTDEDDRIYESTHVRKDGTRFQVLTHMTALRDGAGHVLYRAATFQDITELKHLEEVLRKRNEELATADAAKNQFIAVLSHELRSPLNIIHLWSQILRRPGRSTEEVAKGLDIIAGCTRAQAQLVEDLVDIHRISSDNLRLVFDAVDLGELTSTAVDSMVPGAKEKDIHIDYRGIDTIPIKVWGDSARIQQVLGNLLGNALKYTSQGGDVRVDLRRTGGFAELNVSDTGQGISAADLPHIFAPFRQADPNRKLSPGGLGLGLSIAKHLVDLHGGTISCHSPGEGKGATFTVLLPLLARDANCPPTMGKGAADHVLSLGGALVLVVDDQRAALEPLQTLLEEAGGECVVAVSVDEALDAIRKRLPAVIVSDIAMPGRDGYDLLRSVRELPASGGGQVPMIALTALVTPDDRERALSAGFQAHLAKPIEGETLVAAVAALLPGPVSPGRDGT